MLDRARRVGAVVVVLAALANLIVAGRIGAEAGLVFASPLGGEPPPAVLAPVPIAEVPPVEDAPSPPAEPEVVPTTSAPPPAPQRFRPGAGPASVADVARASIVYHDGPGGEPIERLSNPTHEGLALVFLVLGQQGDWLNVQISRRPNQFSAWVRASDVSVRQSEYTVVVERSAARLTVYRGAEALWENWVAIGARGTPTPLGSFFIDGKVRLADPTGVYGPYQVSVAAFSETLTTFGGGIAQIALHGTNQPGLIGQAVSNGCVRMSNADISRLAETVPSGSPVVIVA